VDTPQNARGSHTRGNTSEAQVNEMCESDPLSQRSGHDCHLCPGVDYGVDRGTVQLARDAEERDSPKRLRVVFKGLNRVNREPWFSTSATKRRGSLTMRDSPVRGFP
jgi:hypothetical protein